MLHFGVCKNVLLRLRLFFEVTCKMASDKACIYVKKVYTLSITLQMLFKFSRSFFVLKNSLLEIKYPKIIHLTNELGKKDSTKGKFSQRLFSDFTIFFLHPLKLLS